MRETSAVTSGLHITMNTMCMYPHKLYGVGKSERGREGGKETLGDA